MPWSSIVTSVKARARCRDATAVRRGAAGPGCRACTPLGWARGEEPETSSKHTFEPASQRTWRLIKVISYAVVAFVYRVVNILRIRT